MTGTWRDNKTGGIVDVTFANGMAGYKARVTHYRTEESFRELFTRIEEPVYVSGGCPADTPKGVTTTASAEPQGSEGLKLCPPAKAYIVPADSTQIVLELNARIAELERERDQYKFDAGMSEARMHELEQQLSEETEAGKVRAAELQGRVHQLERQLAVSGDFLRRLEAALAASDALSEKRRNELVIHQWACHDFVSGVPRSVCPCCGRSKAYGHSEICSWARLARKT
jgi:hypothetical protein